MAIIISEKKRNLLLLKYDNHCAYCGVPNLTLKTMQPDHIVARTKGGGNGIENLHPSCIVCNRFKTNHSIDDFKTLLHFLFKDIIIHIDKKKSKRTLSENFGIIKTSSWDGLFYYEKVRCK